MYCAVVARVIDRHQAGYAVEVDQHIVHGSAQLIEHDLPALVDHGEKALRVVRGEQIIPRGDDQ